MKLISKHAERLNVTSDIAIAHMLIFAEIVGMAENSGRTIGSNRVSTAKGLYQFLDGSMVPALNRLARTTGWKTWMLHAKEHKNANRLSRYQQTLLFLADMLEKKGSDEYMKRIMESGDKEAMIDAYGKLHHTAPDNATVKNFTNVMGEYYG